MLVKAEALWGLYSFTNLLRTLGLRDLGGRGGRKMVTARGGKGMTAVWGSGFYPSMWVPGTGLRPTRLRRSAFTPEPAHWPDRNFLIFIFIFLITKVYGHESTKETVTDP